MASQEGRKRVGRPSATGSTKKRRVKEYEGVRAKTKIVLASEFERWNELRREKGLKKHEEVAKLLLDSYYSHDKTGKGTPKRHTPLHLQETYATTSTPLMSKQQLKLASAELSEISSTGSQGSHSGSLSEESGVQEITETAPAVPVRRHSLHRKPEDRSSSFVNPFDLSITFSEENTEPDSDEDYEPSYDISVRQECPGGIEDVSLEELHFTGDTNEDDVEEIEKEEEQLGPGVIRINNAVDCDELTEDKACLVFLKPLLHLARKKVESVCQVKGCKQPVDISSNFVGSATYLTWACNNGHVCHRWCSQPVLNRRLHGGDLLVSAALLFSGNNFHKIALFCKFLKLHFVSEPVYHRIQRVYLVPTVDEYWNEKQTAILENFAGRDLIVLGDGRMDSPGYSAQYCTYTLMENDSKKIISLVTMDKRAVDRKSTNLEKACFEKSMDILQTKGINVVEVVTDEHLQIGALMKRRFPDIKHSLDIWHSAKNLGKKIIAKSQDKENKDLLPWSSDIVNHFWHACQNASTYEEFVDIWYGVMHHIVDEHEWVMPYTTSGRTKCSHGPLTTDQQKEYLKKGSAAHNALRTIVLDKRFLNKVHYFLNFRNTAELEIFHQQILMYAAKRFSYSPPVYRVRNLLAAIDHNVNFEREIQKNKDGSTRYQRIFNKKSGRWTVVPVKIPKSFNHVFEMMKNCVIRRLGDNVGMHKAVDVEPTDPRRIAKHLAPIPPPPTLEILAEKKSRRQTHE